jgi:hypothetical protein
MYLSELDIIESEILSLLNNPITTTTVDEAGKEIEKAHTLNS